MEPPPSFREVYRRHYTFVWRSLLRLGVEEPTVDDAVQDVFIVVHRKLHAFEGRAAVRTWLFAIARRIALRYRDRARRRAQDEPEADTPTEFGRPDNALSCNEALQQLQDWLDELDEDKRAVFVLSEFEQMRAPEIASMLGANLNTIYARLRAARLHVSRRARREANMESYRSTVRNASEARPAAGAGGRTWCLLVAKLGVTKVATATTGLAGLGITSGFFGKLAIAAAVIGGTTAAAATMTDGTQLPSDTPALASADPVAVDTAVQPRAPGPTIPSTAAAVSASVAPTVVPPTADVPLAPSMVALLSGSTKRRVKRAPAGRVQARDVEAKPEPFAAELERFEQAKVASRRNDTRAALERIDRYLRDFPRGTFSLEAAALRVRTLCKGQRTEEARKAARAFEAEFGQSTLVNVDAPCG
ncbi:MAG: sigma-70 family RNA polymerase sigma factor [Nannocystales bacterium]